MQKLVLKVDFHDDKIKKKAMKAVSVIQGVESVAVDMKENKMTVVGGMDPVAVAGKLRKLSHTEILSVGPKEEKKEEPKKEEKKPEVVPLTWVCYPNYPPHPYYCVTPVEQDPVGCVIC